MSEVMVTGASGGIGRAVASALVGAGHEVSVIGRDPERMRSLAGVRVITADLGPAASASSGDRRA